MNVSIDVMPGRLSIDSEWGDRYAFEGVMRRRWWVFYYNLGCLILRSPVRCAFDNVYLKVSYDKRFFCIDPGLPFEEALEFEVGDGGQEALDMWNEGRRLYDGGG